MIYRSLFPRDFLSELERLQSEVRQNFDISPSIRGFTRGGFPGPLHSNIIMAESREYCA
jgi:HSP20 family protein